MNSRGIIVHLKSVVQPETCSSFEKFLHIFSDLGQGLGVSRWFLANHWSELMERMRHMAPVNGCLRPQCWVEIVSAEQKDPTASKDKTTGLKLYIFTLI